LGGEGRGFSTQAKSARQYLKNKLKAKELGVLHKWQRKVLSSFPSPIKKEALLPLLD
jgi:hypothetical protein